MGIGTFEYDPMVYDVMRELGNQLAGRYLSRCYAATTHEDRVRWRLAASGVTYEVNAVDPYDEAAVRAKSADFGARLSSA